MHNFYSGQEGWAGDEREQQQLLVCFYSDTASFLSFFSLHHQTTSSHHLILSFISSSSLTHPSFDRDWDSPSQWLPLLLVYSTTTTALNPSIKRDSLSFPSLVSSQKEWDVNNISSLVLVLIISIRLGQDVRQEKQGLDSWTQRRSRRKQSDTSRDLFLLLKKNKSE